jgi:hypothetical protein
VEGTRRKEGAPLYTTAAGSLAAVTPVRMITRP